MATPSQSQIIDALQFDMSLINGPINTTNGAVYQMTYAFAGTTQPSDHVGSNYSGWTPLNTSERATYREALDHIESLINVEFVEYNSNIHGSEPDVNVGKVNLSSGTGGIGGYSYSTNGRGDLVSLDGFTVFNNTLDLSGELHLILHEIGHALTNKHPFSGAVTLPEEFDSNKYTVMSYDRNPDNNQDSDAMQIFDILALQDRWGQNDDTNTGDTTYTGSRSTTIDSVWDAGGNDTFDASGKTSDVRLNLIAGAFSSFDATDDVSIAYGVTIENATGGAGDDTLQGNVTANTLLGNAGEDTIQGGLGRDVIWGNGDADKLFGQGGNDRLKGGLGRDVLKGGNGRDLLQGDGGNDRLAGGSNKDTFVFKNGDGRDVILDFQDDQDTLRLKIDGITTLAQVEAVADQSGDDLKLDFAGSDLITLKSLTWAELSNDIDFI